MKRITTLILILAGFFLFSIGVAAQARLRTPRSQNMRRPAQGRLLAVLQAKQEELKITDEQIQQLKDHKLAMEEKAVQHRNAMNIQRLELKKLMLDKENRDLTKIRALLSQGAEYRVDHFISRLKSQEEALNILTLEQREAVKELTKNRIRQQGSQFRGRFSRQPRHSFQRPPARSFDRRFRR